MLTAAGATEHKASAKPAALRIVLVLTLVLLMGHAWHYRFQCDDAFISFRYARNLSRGHGLVFNPGMERVEGYTNFLWVLLLAGLDRLGIRPERAANGLSLIATAALWAWVAWFANRNRPRPALLAAVPTFLLAATRSVAVWSTSGMETRLFEVLLIGGILRCAFELDSVLEAAQRRRAIAGWLLGLATLTRPDAIVVAVPVMVAACWLMHRRRRMDRAWLTATLLPFAALVAGHVAFRRLYYGEWLPNTYYAKIGGTFRWNWGLPYIGAFALEYGAYLWLPLIVVGIRRYLRTQRSHIPVLFGAALLSLALYVAAIGGDHFEYRALDPAFPLGFLVLGEAFVGLMEAARGGLAVAAAGIVIVFGLCDLPIRSHLEFPSRYASGFPGNADDGTPGRAAFLAPEHDLILRLPGLRAIASGHRTLTRFLTSHFVAIRQEEHQLFLEGAVTQGRSLRALVARGVLAADARIAIDCVGAIPYYSELLVLDRHGLTDVSVARARPKLTEVLAHEKVADLDDAVRFGVELWAVDPVNLVVPITSNRLLFAMTHPAQGALSVYAAPVDSTDFVLCVLPLGRPQIAVRMPHLRLVSVLDSAFAAAYVSRATPVFEDLVRREPENLDATNSLAFLLLVQQRFEGALSLYEVLARRFPRNPDTWERIALCEQRLGRPAEERESLELVLGLARDGGDPVRAARVQERLRALEHGQ